MTASEPLAPIDLDRPETYLGLDSEGLVQMTVEFAAQCREAARLGEAFACPAELGEVANVLVCGLGGSAIAGDLARGLVCERLRVPLHVNREYSLPGWVDARTLVVLSSYSGNTEETIAAFQQAKARGAYKVCITSGGKLKRLARQDESPVIEIPSGQPPRASTGYLIFPLLAILEKARLAPSTAGERAEAAEVLEELAGRYAPEAATEKNDAKRAARLLEGKLALIYGWGPMAPVARRWQTQLNENSKLLAHWGELPEMNHNEVVAWAHKHTLAEGLAAVLLRSPEEPPRIRARFELTKRIILSQGKMTLQECGAMGKSRLAQQLSTLYLGDFVSLYLAFLGHKDPAEINAINFLKGELAKLPQ